MTLELFVNRERLLTAFAFAFSSSTFRFKAAVKKHGENAELNAMMESLQLAVAPTGIKELLEHEKHFGFASHSC